MTPSATGSAVPSRYARTVGAALVVAAVVVALAVPAAPAGAAAAAGGGQPLGFTPMWHPRGTQHAAQAWPRAWPQPAVFPAQAGGPLRGLRILLDPGHDVGNFRHTREIAASSWPGLRKGCNTTGTATDSGYREATYAFDVVTRLRRLLRDAGATVIVTRDRNTLSSWGPCVAARGSLGAQVRADLLVSVHADGGPAGGRGFHVIAPAYAKGYTDDIARPSLRLARTMVRGMTGTGLHRSTYLGSTIQVRSDQETLRNSDVPAVIVETLNMRNRGDARLARSRSGRQHVAAGLYAGIRRYVDRAA